MLSYQQKIDEEDLFKAAETNDLFTTLELVRKSITTYVNFKNPVWHKSTPLHVACEHDSHKVVRVLLENKCDLNLKNNARVTSMELIEKHNAVKVKELLRNNERKDPPQMRLRLAVQDSHMGNLVKLLKGGAPVASTTGDMRESLLHVAATYNSKNCVRVLVRFGAPIEAVDTVSATALHRAASHNTAEIAAMLLEAGANKEARDKWQQTPLHKACEKNFVGIVRLLLDQRACLDARDKDGLVPEALARAHKSMAAAKIIRDHLVAEGKRNELLQAAQKDDIDTLRALVLEGVSVNCHVGMFETTALHVAVQHRSFRATHELMKMGADINARDKKGWTPLHKCAIWNAVEVAIALLDAKCDADARDKDDRTPLHMCAENNSAAMAKQLVLEGCDLRVRNGRNRTLQQTAKVFNNPDVYRVLLEAKGAIPSKWAEEFLATKNEAKNSQNPSPTTDGNSP